ncbi:hypothetical protein [Hydrocarboniphaga daqingensis]|uniref:hypothetical protein n=1 Tax=Hydrocarboniphaga daqingensis TaxID=490188 RepID=UPI00111470DD|nr:hypothetical protein [Hydrocarboniphaga daqingensis]
MKKKTKQALNIKTRHPSFFSEDFFKIDDLRVFPCSNYSFKPSVIRVGVASVKTFEPVVLISLDNLEEGFYDTVQRRLVASFSAPILFRHGEVTSVAVVDFNGVIRQENCLAAVVGSPLLAQMNPNIEWAHHSRLVIKVDCFVTAEAPVALLLIAFSKGSPFPISVIKSPLDDIERSS